MKLTKRKISGMIGVFAPIFLAFFIAGSFSYFIFGGPIDAKLAGIADNYILEKVLMYGGGYKLQSDIPVSVINIGDEELARFRSNRQNGVSDINIDEYAAILKNILSFKPKLLVVHWLPMAHEEAGGIREDYQPLIDVLESAKSPSSIIIGYPATGEFEMPSELKAFSTLLDDEICSLRLQGCPYVAKWDDWVVQVMLNKINKDIGEPKSEVITESFSTAFPNIILNLPSPESLRIVSPQNIAQSASLIKNQIVFVGRDIPKSKQSNSWKGQSLSGAITAYNLKDPIKFGEQTPLHTFWAQIAGMWLSKNMVSVTRREGIVGLAVTLSIAVAALTLVFSTNFGLTFMLLSAFFILGSDVLAMHFFQFYVPPFLILYCSFLTLVTAGFLKISYEMYYRWRISERKKAIDFAADLKGNFISLISHNLNTPVAKMQGMVGILQNYAKGSSAEQDISTCVYLASQLSFAVQLILTTIRLRDGGLESETMQLGRVTQEFNDRVAGGLLRKMRFESSLELSEENAEHADLPFKCDRKGLDLLLSCLVVLYSEPGKVGQLTVNLEVDDLNKFRLNVFLTDKRKAIISSDFYENICQSYIELFMQSYFGTISAQANDLTRYQLLLN